MADKARGAKGAKMPPRTAVKRSKGAGIAVRLDLLPLEYTRLEEQATKRGLSKSAYVRLRLLEQIAADERAAATDTARVG